MDHFGNTALVKPKADIWLQIGNRPTVCTYVSTKPLSINLERVELKHFYRLTKSFSNKHPGAGQAT